MQPKWKRIIWCWVVWVMFGIAGCASPPQPFEYHDERDHKSGPGLFSGEEGGYVISTQPSEQKPDAGKNPVETD